MSLLKMLQFALFYRVFGVDALDLSATMVRPQPTKLPAFSKFSELKVA